MICLEGGRIKGGMGIELIEAKSGNDFKVHSAMDRIRRTEGWKFEKATVLCKGNIESVDGVWYYPWVYGHVHESLSAAKRDEIRN